MNTDETPKAVPAATASSTLRTPGRRDQRAARASTAIALTVTTATVIRSSFASALAPDEPLSESSPASPVVASSAPRHPAAPTGRRTNTAAIGSAKTMVSAPSGCTTLSGPYARASTWRTAPVPLSTTAVHQRPRRSAAYGRGGVVAATCSWRMAPAA